MRNRHVMAVTCCSLALFAGTACVSRSGAKAETGHSVQVPESLHEEHQEIHGTLVEATKAPGRVGVAAGELARLLEPHFRREEQVALPPLGLLRPLANGEFHPSMSSVLEMSDALKAELPQMLREHTGIAAAARRLETVAGEEGNLPVRDLAKKLQAHARSEEEIFYPAAILVGEVVRGRAAQAKSSPAGKP